MPWVVKFFFCVNFSKKCVFCRESNSTHPLMEPDFLIDIWCKNEGGEASRTFGWKMTQKKNLYCPLHKQWEFVFDVLTGGNKTHKQNKKKLTGLQKCYTPAALVVLMLQKLALQILLACSTAMTASLFLLPWILLVMSFRLTPCTTKDCGTWAKWNMELTVDS